MEASEDYLIQLLHTWKKSHGTEAPVLPRKSHDKYQCKNINCVYTFNKGNTIVVRRRCKS
jgi:hypothetical protein